MVARVLPRWRLGLSLVLLVALQGCAATAHDVLLDGPGFEPATPACGGFVVDPGGHGAYRTEACETVAVFWSDGACEKFGKACGDALEDLDTDGVAGFLDGFGLMRRVSGHPGLYRGYGGYLRVRDEAKLKEAFGAFTPVPDAIARVLRFEVNGNTWLRMVEELSTQPEFRTALRDALAARRQQLAGRRFGERVIADFWYVAELVALATAARDVELPTTGLAEEVAATVARLADSYGDVARYLASWGPEGQVIDFLRLTRGHVTSTAPATLHEPEPGRAGFGEFVHRALGGLVERDIARDLLALAERQAAAGRPAVAELLRVQAQLHMPVIAKGPEREAISMCREFGPARFLWLGERYVTHLDVPLPLEAPVIEVASPDVATRSQRRQVGERTVRYTVTEAGPGLSPEQQREAAELRARIDVLQRQRDAYYAPSGRVDVDLGGGRRPVVTGWSCNAVNSSCGPTYQVGTEPRSGGAPAPAPASAEALWPFPGDKELAELRAKLERVAPAHLTREATYGERSEAVMGNVTQYQARYTLAIAAGGTRTTVTRTGGWSEDRGAARGDAVCNAIVEAARQVAALDARAAQQRVAAARARANLADPLEQRAAAVTGATRVELARFVAEVIAGEPRPAAPPPVLAARQVRGEGTAAYERFIESTVTHLDMDPARWIDWHQGSWSLGYGVATGALPAQPGMGGLGLTFKRAGEVGTGWYVDGRIVHGLERVDETYGAQLRFGAADMGSTQRTMYTLGVVGGFQRSGGSEALTAGFDLTLSWRMFRQVSLHATIGWNALSLAGLAKETPVGMGPDPDIQSDAYEVTATPHPLSLHLHWLMPSRFYLATGLRGDVSGALDQTVFVELGRTFGFRRF